MSQLVRGNCFQDSFEKLLELEKEGWTLVHGLVTGLKSHLKGMIFAHAWLEKDGLVYSLSPAEVKVDKELYYDLSQITYTKEYSVKEAFARAFESGHYGAWDQHLWDTDRATQEKLKHLYKD